MGCISFETLLVVLCWLQHVQQSTDFKMTSFFAATLPCSNVCILSSTPCRFVLNQTESIMKNILFFIRAGLPQCLVCVACICHITMMRAWLGLEFLLEEVSQCYLQLYEYRPVFACFVFWHRNLYSHVYMFKTGTASSSSLVGFLLYPSCLFILLSLTRSFLSSKGGTKSNVFNPSVPFCFCVFTSRVVSVS